jgi:hypothetical protein
MRVTKGMKVLFVLSFLVWIGLRVIVSIEFNHECGGHLKRAADASTIEMAKTELETSLKYLEANNLTKGYTSVIYNTPNEDIRFWYQNLKASFTELEKVSPEASQLEKTNILMKLRETLLDTSENGVKVTIPQGIAIFPFNMLFAGFGLITSVLCVIGVIPWDDCVRSK